MDTKTARSQLHELLQVISNAHGVSSIVPEVVYETIADPPPAQHVCHLSLQLPTESEPMRFVTAHGKRKAAYEAAASLALARLQHALPRPRLTVELPDVLRDMLVPGQGTKRNPEMVGHLAGSIAAGKGPVVPLGVVLRCKTVRQWLVQQHVDDGDPEACAACLRRALMALRTQSAEVAHMDVLHDGWALQLRPSHPLCAQPPHPRGVPAATSSLAVLLPVDTTAAMQEVPLDLGRPVLLETIAQLLGGTAPWQVLVHGKVGRRGVQGVQGVGAQQAGSVAEGESALERPFLYSLPPARRRVHGPALLACAWVPNHGTCGLQEHGPYTVAHALRHIGMLMPSAEWASAQPGWIGQFVCGLPTQYRASRVWQGPSPLQLLSTYTAQHAQPPLPPCADPNTPPSAAVWAGGPVLHAPPVEVEDSADDAGVDDDGSTDAAGRRAQEEALQLLRALEAASLRLFGADVGNEGKAEGGRPDAGSANPGSLRQPVRMGDAVQLQLSPASALVLGLQGTDHPPACLYMDTGSVPCSLIDGLLVARRGDMVLATVDVPAASPPDPLTTALGLVPTTRRSLAVHITKVTSATGGPGSGGLFSPALSVQRYSLVGAIAAALGCQDVLDVGCGGGRLLTHLGAAAVCGALPTLRTLRGCDISEPAIKSASGAIARFHAAQPTCCVDVQATLADMLDPMAQLPDWAMRADFVCMVEVVEHLDPEPLDQVPALLLGRLRPPVAVVTTPNSEYNPVLAARGGGLLANNMRNSDHRFEWTRREFASWAKKHAVKHGYRVRLMGVGKVVDEGPTLEKLGLKDVGAASQMAIFTLENAA